MKRKLLFAAVVLSLVPSLSYTAGIQTVPEKKSVPVQEYRSKLSCYVAAEYLHWKIQEDLLNYAANIPGGFPKDGLIFSQQVFVVNQHFDHGPGFKIMAGADYKDNIGGLFAWTHLEKTTCGSIQGDAQGVFATAFFGFLDTGGLLASAASSKFHIDFDVADVQAERRWFPLKKLFLRPYLGVRWARIKQTQDIEYSGIEGSFTIEVDRRNDFKGFGPSAGIDEKLYLFRNIAIVGSVSGALLYGKFHMESLNKVVAGSDSLGPIVSECKKRLRPMAQIILGGMWEPSVFQGALELGVAYEAQYWWNQWQMMPSAVGLFSSTMSQGDLMLHGLVLHAGLRF